MATTIKCLSLVFGLSATVIAQSSGPGYLKANLIPFSYKGVPYSYQVNLSIGTPPQNLGLLLDTGSSDTWVKDKSLCPRGAVNANGEPLCPGGSFSPQHSSSLTFLNKVFNDSYASGATTGQYFTDNVLIGDTMLHNITLAVANATQELPGGISGIIGVSNDGLEANAQDALPYLYKANATENITKYEHPTIGDELVSQGFVNRRAFSLFLDRAGAGSHPTLIWSGIDSSKYTGDLVAVPVRKYLGSYSFLLTPLTSVGVVGSYDGTEINTSLTGPDFTGVEAILDSGTSDMTLPKPIVEEIYNAVGATVDQSGVALVPCAYGKANISITLQLGGDDGPIIAVPASAVIEEHLPTEYNGIEWCELAITPITARAGVTLLGDRVMRSAYLVYDLENPEYVAIAQANYDAAGSQIEAMPPNGTAISQIVSTVTFTTASAPTGQITASANQGSPQTASGAAAPTTYGSPTISGLASPTAAAPTIATPSASEGNQLNGLVSGFASVAALFSMMVPMIWA